MKSIIDELFYENLSPGSMFPRTDEYKRLTAESIQVMERLRNTLGRRQSKLLGRLLDLEMEITAAEAGSYFRIGFCLGARFMREMLEFSL